MGDVETIDEVAYHVRPSFRERFPAHRVKDVIKRVLDEMLGGVSYDHDAVMQLSKEIADKIKNEIKALEVPRYKIMVQVLIGEQRGEGARMGCRCFWDKDCDSLATESFSSDSLFATATAFGVYHY